MDLKEIVGVKGHFKIFGRYSPNEPWRLLREKDNLVVSVGRTLMRDLLSGESSANLQSFAFGTGTTTPVIGDTGLVTPMVYDGGTNIYKAFEEFTEDDFKTVTYVGYLSSLQPTTDVDITEVGLFTGLDAVQGIMFCRATFDAITKTTAIELRLEYSIEI